MRLPWGEDLGTNRLALKGTTNKPSFAEATAHQ